MLLPLMPTLPLAVLVLLTRSTMSQMDVPVRQSYTMAVVDPDERSAAAGVTGIARTAGTSISPLIAGPLIAGPLIAVPGLAAVPFLLAGGLKIVYDLLLWRAFRSTPAPEDPTRGSASSPESPG
jgi:MFS family permease